MVQKRKTRHGVSVRAALLVAAAGAFLLPAAVPAAAVPDPESGRWATTTVALLEHSGARCTEIGERILKHWRTLSGSGAQQQKVLDRFVLTRTTSDMSAAREALDIARRFLPEATRETTPGTGAVLQQLFDSETALCNAVAQPSPPRDAFETRLAEIARQIESVKDDLGRLMTVSDEELDKTLRPYLPSLAAAAERAEEKNRRDLATEPVVETGPTFEQRMAAWHQRYTQAVTPTKLALRDYLRGRQATDSRAIHAACRELLSAVQTLLDQPGVFRAPDEKVEEPLARAYRALRFLGGHCTAGRFRDVDEQYLQVRQELTRAAQLLAPYGLQP